MTLQTDEQPKYIEFEGCKKYERNGFSVIIQ